MKKIINIIFLICITLLSSSCFKKATEEEARLILHKHLEERYGESFAIGTMGIRATDQKMWYEADIIPAKYIGTPKEYDSYYSSIGTVRINRGILGQKLSKGGDIYMSNRLDMRASEFFQPKLEELFGKNVISVIKIRTREYIDNGDDFLKVLNHNKSLGARFYLTGGIYIFGQVNSDSDREKYREKIYQLVQYFKEVGVWDGIGLWIVVADERVLSDEFVENSGERWALENIYDDNPRDYSVMGRITVIKTEEYLKKRAEIMNRYSESFIKTSDENKLKIIDGYGKGAIYGENALGLAKLTYYNILLRMPLYSPQYIENQMWKDEKIKSYDSPNDVEFEEEIYYRGDTGNSDE